MRETPCPSGSAHGSRGVNRADGLVEYFQVGVFRGHSTRKEPVWIEGELSLQKGVGDGYSRLRGRASQASAGRTLGPDRGSSTLAKNQNMCHEAGSGCDNSISRVRSGEVVGMGAAILPDGPPSATSPPTCDPAKIKDFVECDAVVKAPSFQPVRVD
jgi:hypothetical protein